MSITHPLVYLYAVLNASRWPHSVVLEKEGANDGLVSVESSKWVRCVKNIWAKLNCYHMQGTYLGTLENVSHLDLVRPFYCLPLS